MKTPAPTLAIALALSFSLSSVAHAQNLARPVPVGDQTPLLQALPSSLHETMKAMSATLKTLSAQADDASKNQSSAALADQLAALTLHAKSFTPDSISELRADQQAKAKQGYDAILEQTAADARSLAKAFRENRNADAVKLIDKINQDKKDGHGDFK